MQYRRLGAAGVRVSAISLGAWLTYGGTVNAGAAAECVRAALAEGVNFLDLADVYANGEAELVVGGVLKNLNRPDLVISSKCYWPMTDGPNDRGLSRKHIIESVHASLRRLGTDYLDIFFAHRFDPETPIEEVVRAMDDLIHQGKVLYWGTSFWSAAQIEMAVGAAQRLNAYLPQVEQPRYSMLDRHVEGEIIQTAARHGMGITVFSPLAQGMLSGKYNHGVPAGSRADISNWLSTILTDANIQRVRRLSEVAADLGIEMSQLALAWILRLPEVTCAITGATRPEQVRSNVRAADITLTAETLAQIEQILA
jgi:voltage-dependent potassium channel beta subunit